MPRSEPKLNEEQKSALVDAIFGRTPEVDEDPFEDDEEVSEDLQTESSVEGKALDVAKNFVDVLDKIPDLNKNQRRIAYYLSRGKAASVIAAKCRVTSAYVRQLRDDPRIQALVKIFKEGGIYDLVEEISAQEVLDRAQVRAAELLAEKMNAALDENTQIKAALAILDRTGHTKGGDSAPVHITIERDAIEVYRDARREAGIEEADYEVVDE